MRKPHLLAVLAACVLAVGLIAAYGIAQQPGRQPMVQAAPAIALLDVPAIFKQHTRFKAMMNDMKADAQRDETQMKAEREAQRRLVELLQQYRKGTPEYKDRAAEITKRQADLSVKIRLHNDDYRTREAKIFHTVYQEILQEVDYYCLNNGISMVLKFSGATADVEQPESVVPYINRSVVWHTNNHDITPVILHRLNQRAFRPSAPTNPGGGTTPIGTRPPPGVTFPR